MKRLALSLAVLLAGAPAAARAQAPGDPIAAAVDEAAARAGLPPAWIRRVIARESGGAPYAVSPAGALGLMQLMPDTWRELSARLGLGADPFDVHDNVLAGAAYLREMLDRFGSPGFLAAYNAGPARYAAALAGRSVLPRETRAYVARLAPELGFGAAPAARPNGVSAAAQLFPESSGLFAIPPDGRP
jgi:soluble lytic murein transglycosylase-like protein